jgi:hypothetical protein
MAMNEREEASYRDHLEQLIVAKDKEIEGLKAQIADLKKQKGISSAQEGLTFDERTGIWTDEKGKPFCPTCLNAEKRNPLKVESSGWRCTAAGHYFGKPGGRVPVVVRGRSGGGGSWMSS